MSTFNYDHLADHQREYESRSLASDSSAQISAAPQELTSLEHRTTLLQLIFVWEIALRNLVDSRYPNDELVELLRERQAAVRARFTLNSRYGYSLRLIDCTNPYHLRLIFLRDRAFRPCSTLWLKRSGWPGSTKRTGAATSQPMPTRTRTPFSICPALRRGFFQIVRKVFERSPDHLRDRILL